jgi:hypothetical protein
MAEPRRGSVHESPMRRQPHAHNGYENGPALGNLDFLSRGCLRVINSDLKHGKALL